MNSAELLSILQGEIKDKFIVEDFHVYHCTYCLENSTTDDICFYYLKETERAEQQFQQRLSRARTNIIIFNRRPHFRPGTSYMVVAEDYWMEAQKKICDIFYPVDWKSKKIIGVTGTNGKTTTVYFALQILQQIGEKGFSIGSLGVCDVSGLLEEIGGMTTPPYIQIRKIIFRYFGNYNFCVMEVSSHALAQERIYKIQYDATGWTNFGQDHLDYHQSLENYFQQKLKFPKYYMKNNKSLLVPGTESGLLNKLSQIPQISFHLTDELEKFGAVTQHYPHYVGTSFNHENLKMAAALVQDACKRNISVQPEGLSLPPGRFEILQVNSQLAILDSAHTPDAMGSVLDAIRESFPERKIITIFGCGGERDRHKRPLMGKIAEEKSDITIITSDNPRYENPDSIIDEITVGMVKYNYRQIDRSKAISLGVSLLEEKGKETVLAILGKGSETYQILGGQRKTLSDRDEFYRYAERGNDD